MSILMVIVVGFIIGSFARLFMASPEPGGLVTTVLIGIGGAVLATFVSGNLGWRYQDPAVGIISAIVGASVLLFVYRLMRRRPGTRPS